VRCNVGVRCGKESVIVLDKDPRNGGAESLARLTKEHGELPATPGVSTGGGGAHYYFRAPAEPIRKGTLAPGVDLLADGSNAVAPPSLHGSGKRYEWKPGRSPSDVALAELPAWIVEAARKAKRTPNNGARAGGDGEPIPKGRRNAELTSLAGTMRRRGMSEAAIRAALLEVNRERCDPPMEEAEIEEIAHSLAKYKPGSDGTAASVTPPRVVELPEAKAPTLAPEAYDLAPEPFQNIIRFYAGRTEAPDSFLLYSLATWAGALFGRSIHNPYAGGCGVPPLLYTILVAPAGRRKTTADNIIRRAIIPPRYEATAFGVMERRGTIGSGPALLEVLAAAEDELGAGATTIWRPPEWAGVLRASEREGGRDLVPILLGAFDGFTNYMHAVRNKKSESGGVTVHLSRPGLAIISTAQETMLRAHLTAETVGLGLASRLLMVFHGAPVEAVPFPERAFRGADYSTVNTAAESIRDAAKFWRESAKDKPDGIPIEIPEGSEAAAAWAKWYTAEYEKDREAGTRDADRAAELLVRVPEYARRIALIRAAVERRDAIDATDIEWGIVLAEFAGMSAAYLCCGAGVGETRQDARTRALLEIIHGARGEWIRVRDLYRNRRAARNAREAFDLIRSLHDAGAVEFREGIPRRIPALVRCCCADCEGAGDNP
jgi:hypothetical protein